jgi:hypothetical protein
MYEHTGTPYLRETKRSDQTSEVFEVPLSKF